MSILVIGGGATGTGIARDLSMRGFDVTLIEKQGLGGGTSGKSHGLLHSGARYAENDPKGAEGCIRENRIIRRIGGECVRDTDGLFVQLQDDKDEYFEEKHEACENIGIDVEILDKEETKNLVPHISDSVVRSMKVPDAVIYPSRLVALNAKSAENHGADILTDTKVEDMKIDGGKIDSVTMSGQENEGINPDYVVNSTGAWAGEIGDIVDVDINMSPSRGVMLAVTDSDTEPVVNRCRAPSDGDIIIPHENQAVLGTTSVPVSKAEGFETDEEEIERCIRECSKMVPSVRDADIERVWWGVRPLYKPSEFEDTRQISRGFYLLDHEKSPVDNMISVVGGKLTTYRKMAESVADHICDEFGINEECRTDIEPLPHRNDEDKINELVERYGGYNETDRNLSSRNS